MCPLPLPLRQVAYSDTFTRLGLRIPPTSAGSIRVTSVRTTVYAGPTTADPVASDRIVIGTDGAAGVGSVIQARTTGPVPGFGNTWLVCNISTGRWTHADGAPEAKATIGMQCTVAVTPAAPPVRRASGSRSRSAAAGRRPIPARKVLGHLRAV